MLIWGGGALPRCPPLRPSHAQALIQHLDMASLLADGGVCSDVLCVPGIAHRLRSTTLLVAAQVPQDLAQPMLLLRYLICTCTGTCGQLWGTAVAAIRVAVQTTTAATASFEDWSCTPGRYHRPTPSLLCRQPVAGNAIVP